MLAAFVFSACKGDGPKPPTTVTAVSSAQFVGVVGDLVADPLVVRVTDAGGGGSGGIIVTFVVAEGGGTVSPAVDTTDDAGLATTRWRLGGTAGQQRVTATVAGVPTAASFVATGLAAGPAVVAIQGGDNQSAVGGAAVAAAPSVIVRDRFNNLVPGTSVFFSVASGGGSVTGSGATTNAAGVASVGSWTLGAATGANRLTALVVSNGVTNNPITFNATATPGAAAGMTAQTPVAGTGAVGQLVTPVPSVRIVDGNGNPVVGAAVTFAASAGSTVIGGGKTTNVNGVAAPDGWQLGSTAQSYTLTASATGVTSVVFTVSARAGAPTTVAILAGNNQTATVGRTLPTDPAIRVVDIAGNPVAGLEVQFDVTAGGGTAVSRRQTTDANGTATVGAWTLGDTPGVNTLRATVNGVTLAGNPVVFSATATAGAPSIMVVFGGNNQSARVATPVPASPSVLVRDVRGNPVAGIAVNWITAGGSGMLTGANSVTNSAGVATVGSWTLGATAGTQTLTASAVGVPDVSFTATATAGVAARAAAVGDSVVGIFPVTNFVSPLPTVRITDSNGNPVSGAVVTFSLDAVGGTGAALTGVTQTTGANGLATLGTWRLGSLATTYRVRALVSGLDLAGLEPTFTVTGTAGAPADVQVAVTSLQSQAAVASTAVTLTPVVRVSDLNGNGVANIPVTFMVASGTSTIAGGLTSYVVSTDAFGFASASTWVMGAGPGTRTITATVTGAGIVNNPITFTAIVP